MALVYTADNVLDKTETAASELNSTLNIIREQAASLMQQIADIQDNIAASKDTLDGDTYKEASDIMILANKAFWDAQYPLAHSYTVEALELVQDYLFERG